ncbi:hypothetical protein M409DRAFT_61762 [Zasmidium cellare ATCC 36951]|uniref:Zn(2)-C6 fungal-type domain-containing protein n=1 Tax=Zasmidium cellare ATCC 36951 TaxID=1080233 RepID=A0A6A6BU79_ZASCE|nr:uncharacterized protein M409DRAFT_61762 [Zasmidium cellare ATCC 36951]KAF2158321.1 hypothetical protein M409DRAFT_61762 [Zasmidium cellare ATCC 36951]
MHSQKRAPLIKQSCDACSSAKVRCSKDELACSRCRQKGFTCIYSASRRAGRRSTVHLVTRAGQQTEDSYSTPFSPSLDSSPLSKASSLSRSLEAEPQCSTFGQDTHSESFDMFNAPSTGVPQYAAQISPFSISQDSRLSQYAYTTNGTSGGAPPCAVMQPSCDILDMSYPQTTALGMDTVTNLRDLGDLDDLSGYSDTSSGSGGTLAECEAVHNELASLSSLAESMERKFDVIVGERLQYRDLYTEFGIPIDAIEADCHTHLLPGTQCASPMEAMLSLEPVQIGGPGFRRPSVNEMGFYMSLAELKRRLRWMKEDLNHVVTA